MKKMQNPSLRKRKGFTLIELIVVIAILAILAAIAIPAFVGTLNRSKVRSHNANVRIIQSAIKVYEAETGNTLVGALDAAGLAAVLVPNYIDAIPDDPRTNPVQAGYGLDVNEAVTPGIDTSVS